jgi:hypothetical protein
MSRITGVIVALATAAAVLTGSTVGAEPAPAGPPAAGLPKEIPGGVELTLADGDVLRVWAADNNRAVFSRRLDAATGAWGPRLEVVRRKNLYCGEVEGRTANGAVALLAQCDEGGYYEDTAPVSSQALWSPDGVTWSSYTLDGEAYEEPGISPDGQNAVWPMHQRYTTRTAAGFTDHTVRADGQEYTVTATITDTAQVSFLYFAQSGRRCPLVVQTRTGDAAPVRQEVRVAGGCSDVALVNTDSNTVWYGEIGSEAYVSVVERPDGASPWALTHIAPAYAPGLQTVELGRLPTDFFAADGLPLIAISSERGRLVRAQLYDRASQTWGASRVVHDAGATGCRWGDTYTATLLAVIAVDLRCGGRHVVLTTRDGVTWQALRMGKHVLGISSDGAQVAVPGRSRTHVISAERGVVTLPLPVTGRCDVVVPDGPDGAVLLTAAGRHRGWPTVLQHSSPTGWTRLSRTDLPTYPRACGRVRSSSYDLPVRFDIRSGWKGYTVQVVERDGVWAARRRPY